ncbi:bacteriohemerythrin [Azospirillum halopraeferens]|uniref:bacteriohemerythrin n=1 Tax=Azospirillum halopraeferens TaxID=34010 RepID=UPI0004124E81|nr:bacteriohemerythrin [Azospirillum halopraeferens]
MGHDADMEPGPFTPLRRPPGMPPAACLIWHPSYETGIERIDEQHRSLFALHGDFVHAVERGGSIHLLDSMARDLIRYADLHFHDEEEAMARFGYTGLDRHRTLHTGLRATVARLDRLPQERTSLLVVAEFVKLWMREHILVEDRDFARFVRSGAT